MFGMWMRFMFESTLLGLEAQRVIMRRMIAMSASVVRHYRSRVRANETSPITATAQAPVSERSSRSAIDPQGTLSPAIPMAHQTGLSAFAANDH
jgi:hypothetical protein